MRFSYTLEPDSSVKILGITLRYARLKEGYSLRDMGDLANISHTLIANIERGKTVANQATLRQLFSILKLSFRDDASLVNEFRVIYERTFNRLYQGDYDLVDDDIRLIEKNLPLYEQSVVFVDTLILLFVHAVLTRTMSDYLRNYYDLALRVTDLLSLKQQQMVHFVVGVSKYNQGQYLEAYKELSEAVNVGDYRFDPLVNLYRIRCQVKMFRFMDAQQLAEQTIAQFEDTLNYQRAMYVRLQLAYANLSLRKYDKAVEYIDLVEGFGQKYKDTHLLITCLDRRLAMKMTQADMSGLHDLLGQVIHNTVTVTIARILYYGGLGEYHLAQEAYQLYLHQNHPLIDREEWYLKGFMFLFGGTTHTEDEFIDTFEHIIAFGQKALDQELLQFGYDQLILLYRNKRMYKKALTLSEESRMIRSYGELK